MGSMFELIGADNFTERYILRHGKPLEINELELLLRSISNKRALVVDIGANVGLYSVLLGMAVGEDSKIVSFEPNSEVRKRLRKNLELNKLKNVTVFPFAVGEKNEESELHIPPRNKGEASLIRRDDASAFENVQVRKLADFGLSFSDFETSVLKIDVEGHESAVLLPFLEEQEPQNLPTYIQYETSHLSSSARSKIAELLAKKGYKKIFGNRMNSIYRRSQYTLFSCQRNEGIFLPEWISYHKAIGFDRIVIFSNDCEDGSDALLDELQENGEIEHYTFSPGNKAPQFEAAKLAMELQTFSNGEWVIWLDTDEFLNIHRGQGNVRDLVACLEGADGIAINWRLFGSGREEKDWSGSQLHRQFCFGSNQQDPTNRQIKTLFRFSEAIKGLDPHRPEFTKSFRKEGRVLFDGDLKPVAPRTYYGRRSSGSLKHTLPIIAKDPVAQINHYIVRNKQLFQLKLERGRGYRDKASKRRHTSVFFARHNKNDVIETSILRHVGKERIIRARMLSLPNVSTLYGNCESFALGVSRRLENGGSSKIQQSLKNQTTRAFRRLRLAHENAPNYNCPLCGYYGKFAPMGVPLRIGARCPNCGSLERHRLLHLSIEREKLFAASDSVLHFAPDPQIQKILQSLVQTYHTTDLRAKNVTFQLDIENLDIADQSYDKVVCSHVLEHVDDVKALSEVYRILKPGGMAVFAVPIVEGWDTTYENTSVTSPEGRKAHFGQRDHVRIYGRDFRERITDAGFSLREVPSKEPDIQNFGLLRGERLFLASRSGFGDK